MTKIIDFNEKKHKIPPLSAPSNPHSPKEVVVFKDSDLRNLRICEEDMIVSSSVYMGSLSNLVKINNKLDWKVERDLSEETELDEMRYLTLNEVYEQVREEYGERRNGKLSTPIITVIVDEPLRGDIYQCNNHEEGEWEKIGGTRGYV